MMTLDFHTETLSIWLLPRMGSFKKAHSTLAWLNQPNSPSIKYYNKSLMKDAVMPNAYCLTIDINVLFCGGTLAPGGPTCIGLLKWRIQY